MNCFFQIDYISSEALDFIRQHEEVTGVILGDYVCNKRMFSGGYAGMIKSISDFTKINKEIIIQTPLYLTERSFCDVVDSIIFLAGEYKIKKFLVQDVGMLTILSNKIPDVELVWSQMGRNRGTIMNIDSVLFLHRQGISGMELCSKSRIDVLSGLGMKAYAAYGKIIYKTISRNCYNKYFDNKIICRDDCRDHKKMITSKTGATISVDGFFLGKMYIYDNSCGYWQSVKNNCENVVIHAENMKMAKKYFYKYKELIKTYE